MLPSGSLEPVESKWQARSAQVADAITGIGGWLVCWPPAWKTNIEREFQVWLSLPGPEICTAVPDTGAVPAHSARQSRPVVSAK